MKIRLKTDSFIFGKGYKIIVVFLLFCLFYFALPGANFFVNSYPGGLYLQCSGDAPGGSMGATCNVLFVVESETSIFSPNFSRSVIKLVKSRHSFITSRKCPEGGNFAPKVSRSVLRSMALNPPPAFFIRKISYPLKESSSEIPAEREIFHPV